MGRVTWRGVRSHPVRFLLSILAVLLGIAFVSGTFSLRAMMASTFDDIIDQSMTADVYVQGPETGSDGGGPMSGGSRQLVPMDLAETVAAVPGVERVVPDISGSAVLVGKDGTAVSSGMSPTLATWLPADDPDLTVPQGRLPQKAGEIALETGTLDRSGLAVGDTTQVLIGGEITEQTIVGEVRFDIAMAGATFLAFDHDTAAAAFAPDGLVQNIAVTAASGVDPAGLSRDIAAGLPDGATAEVETGDAIRQENKDAISDQLGFVETFLLIFAVIALVVGAFIIFNTFQMIVRQRMPEIAVLRAIGASPGQVFASVLGQAAIVGFVGSAVGVVAGLGLVQALRAILASTGMELSGSVPLTVGGVLMAFAFGLGVSVLAAAVPAVRAARVPPVEAMRDGGSAKEHGTLGWGITGGVLLAGGVAALVACLQGGDNAGLLLGLGAVGLLLGALAVSPVVAPWVVRVLALPFLALRPLGRLARGNVTRNSVRTSITSGALMIGMALIGGASVMAASVQESMAGIVDSDVQSDFVLRSGTWDIATGALDAAEQVDGVERLDRYYVATLDVDGESVFAASAAPSMFRESIDPRVQSGSVDAFADGEAMVQESFAQDNDLALGDTVTVTNPQVPGAETTLRIGAVIKSVAVDSPVVVPLSALEVLVPEGMRQVPSAFLEMEPGADLEQVRDGLTQAVKPYLVVSVLDHEEFSSSLADQVNQILTVLYALLGLSIFVAVIGIVNTLALSIMERTREIGMMRAVGLGKLQLSTTITIESILIAVFGAVSGLLVGVGVASALPSVFADQGMSELVIPWGSLGVMLGLAVVVGALAALWPAVRAARLPVLQAVTYD